MNERRQEMKEDNKNRQQYDDIINLQHHVSSNRDHMSMINRAAQFSPFAAVTGYDGAIKETARLTDLRIELDENEKTILDEKLRIVQEQLSRQLEIEFIYFRPDEMKAGGDYISMIGTVKKIDGYERVVLMQDGTRIPIEEIIDITGDVFRTENDRFTID